MLSKIWYRLCVNRINEQLYEIQTLKMLFKIIKNIKTNKKKKIEVFSY